jgi:hypothetical protein
MHEDMYFQPIASPSDKTIYSTTTRQKKQGDAKKACPV